MLAVPYASSSSHAAGIRSAPPQRTNTNDPSPLPPTRATVTILSTPPPKGNNSGDPLMDTRHRHTTLSGSAMPPDGQRRTATPGGVGLSAIAEAASSSSSPGGGTLVLPLTNNTDSGRTAPSTCGGTDTSRSHSSSSNASGQEERGPSTATAAAPPLPTGPVLPWSGGARERRCWSAFATVLKEWTVALHREMEAEEEAATAVACCSSITRKMNASHATGKRRSKRKDPSADPVAAQLLASTAVAASSSPLPKASEDSSGAAAPRSWGVDAFNAWKAGQVCGSSSTPTPTPQPEAVVTATAPWLSAATAASTSTGAFRRTFADVARGVKVVPAPAASAASAEIESSTHPPPLTSTASGRQEGRLRSGGSRVQHLDWSSAPEHRHAPMVPAPPIAGGGPPPSSGQQGTSEANSASKLTVLKPRHGVAWRELCAALESLEMRVDAVLAAKQKEHAGSLEAKCSGSSAFPPPPAAAMETKRVEWEAQLSHLLSLAAEPQALVASLAALSILYEDLAYSSTTARNPLLHQPANEQANDSSTTRCTTATTKVNTSPSPSPSGHDVPTTCSSAGAGASPTTATTTASTTTGEMGAGTSPGGRVGATPIGTTLSPTFGTRCPRASLDLAAPPYTPSDRRHGGGGGSAGGGPGAGVSAADGHPLQQERRRTAEVDDCSSTATSPLDPASHPGASPPLPPSPLQQQQTPSAADIISSSSCSSSSSSPASAGALSNGTLQGVNDDSPHTDGEGGRRGQLTACSTQSGEPLLHGIASTTTTTHNNNNNNNNERSAVLVPASEEPKSSLPPAQPSSPRSRAGTRSPAATIASDGRQSHAASPSPPLAAPPAAAAPVWTPPPPPAQVEDTPRTSPPSILLLPLDSGASSPQPRQHISTSSTSFKAPSTGVTHHLESRDEMLRRRTAAPTAFYNALHGHGGSCAAVASRSSHRHHAGHHLPAGGGGGATHPSLPYPEGYSSIMHPDAVLTASSGGGAANASVAASSSGSGHAWGGAATAAPAAAASRWGTSASGGKVMGLGASSGGPLTGVEVVQEMEGRSGAEERSHINNSAPQHPSPVPSTTAAAAAAVAPASSHPALVASKEAFSGSHNSNSNNGAKTSSANLSGFPMVCTLSPTLPSHHHHAMHLSPYTGGSTGSPTTFPFPSPQLGPCSSRSSTSAEHPLGLHSSTSNMLNTLNNNNAHNAMASSFSSTCSCSSSALRGMPASNCPYDYILVLDFEATCEEYPPPQYLHEIIEFPVVLVDTHLLRPMAEFHSYVKPRDKPVLSDFCRRLTGIEQAQIDGAPPLEEVLRQFERWYFNTLPPNSNAVFATDGSMDLQCFMYTQAVCRQGVSFPMLFYQWLDVKQVFSAFFQCPTGKIKAMLEVLHRPLEGRLHSGMDDARNIATIVIGLLQWGSSLTEAPVCRVHPNASPVCFSSPCSRGGEADPPQPPLVPFDASTRRREQGKVEPSPSTQPLPSPVFTPHNTPHAHTSQRRNSRYGHSNTKWRRGAGANEGASIPCAAAASTDPSGMAEGNTDASPYLEATDGSAAGPSCNASSSSRSHRNNTLQQQQRSQQPTPSCCATAEAATAYASIPPLSLGPSALSQEEVVDEMAHTTSP
eukprot:gene874-505_t